MKTRIAVLLFAVLITACSSPTPTVPAEETQPATEEVSDATEAPTEEAAETEAPTDEATAVPVPTATPVPVAQPITTDNAASLQAAAIIGQGDATHSVWSPDGAWLAVGSTQGIWIYDAASLEGAANWATDTLPTRLIWNPDSSGLLMLTHAGHITMFDPASGDVQWEADTAWPYVMDAEFTADGALVTASSPVNTSSSQGVILQDGILYQYNQMLGMQDTAILEVWDAASGEQTGTIETIFSEIVDIDTHPTDANQIVAGGTRKVRSFGGYMALYDLSTSEELMYHVAAIQQKATHRINTVDFTADGTHVLASSQSITILLNWELEGGNVREIAPMRFGGGPIDVELYGENNQIFAAQAFIGFATPKDVTDRGADFLPGYVNDSTRQTGRASMAGQFLHPFFGVNNLPYFPMPHVTVIESISNLAEQESFRTGDYISSISVHPDGSRYVATSYDGSVTVVNLDEARAVEPFTSGFYDDETTNYHFTLYQLDAGEEHRPHSELGEAMAVSPDGSEAAVMLETGQIAIFDPATLEVKRTLSAANDWFFRYNNSYTNNSALAYIQNGAQIVQLHNATVRILDAESGELILSDPDYASDELLPAPVDPELNTFLVNKPGMLRLMPFVDGFAMLQDGDPVDSYIWWLLGDPAAPTRREFSPQWNPQAFAPSGEFAIGFFNGKLNFFEKDAAKGWPDGVLSEERPFIDLQRPDDNDKEFFGAYAFSSDESWLVWTGTRRPGLWIANTQTGETLAVIDYGDERANGYSWLTTGPAALAISPDDSIIAVGLRSGTLEDGSTVQLLDTSLNVIATIAGPAEGVVSLGFAADGTTLLALGEDGVLYQYQVLQ